MSGDLETLIERAAAAAAKAPEHLQEAAFNRAFEYLSGSAGEPAPKPPHQSRSPRRAKQSAQTKPAAAAAENPAADLHARFDRTKVAGVSTATPVLDRALRILRAAHDEYGVDGLTAPQIADILTNNLRVKTQRQHVNRALDGATSMVARRKDGRTVIYRIMEAGEEFLDAGGSNATKDSAATPPRRATRRKSRPSSKSASTAAAAPVAATASDQADKTPATGRRGRAGRPGPKAAVEWLLDQGFFGEPRTIGEIQDQLAHKRGHKYKVTDLSPALVRLLRDGRFDRERDDAGQYRYRAA